MKKGGQLKMMECEEKETLRSLMKSCDKLGIAYKECVFDRNGKESYGVIFADKNEDAMKQLRTDYLVANHKLFQVDQDTIRRFNAQQEPEKISGLDFAEMSYMKDRAAKTICSLPRKGKRMEGIPFTSGQKTSGFLIRSMPG